VIASAGIAAVAPAGDELEADFNLVLVVERDDAEALREIGVEAAALREPGWRDALPSGGSVLLVGAAQRLAGDLRRLGVGATYAVDVPLPCRHAAQFIDDAGKRAGRVLLPAEAREVWRVVTDRALPVQAAPNFEGHPELARKPRRLAVVRSLDEVLGLPPLAWLVRDLCPASGVGLLVGPPNVGKSALAVDLAFRVASGQDWHGRAVAAGPVIYCAGEGVAGLGQRATAWLESTAARPVHDLGFVTGLPALSCEAGRAEFAAILEERRPKLAIVDTIAAHWADSEDRAEVVGPAMAALQALAARVGCLVLLLHHERKPSAQPVAGGAWAAVRGSGAWVGSADVVLSLSGTPDALVLACTKQRDAERAKPVELVLRAVDLAAGGRGVIVTPRAPAASVVEPLPELRTRDRLRAALASAGAAGLSFAEACAASGRSKATTSEHLARFVDDDEAETFPTARGLRWRVRAVRFGGSPLGGEAEPNTERSAEQARTEPNKPEPNNR
jgi:hypothetical protein